MFMNLLLFLAGVFLLTFLLGRLLERIRIPWIFSSLLLGLGLAAYNPFPDITSSSSFLFMAELGMFFILFLIGFEINFTEIRRRGSFIIKTTLAVILSEAFFITFLVHYFFAVSWPISLLVAFSFATVGEAVLLPILDEFRLTKTPLGQTIIGIGFLNDVLEIAAIIVLVVLVGSKTGHAGITISFTLLILAILFSMAYLLTRWKEKAAKIHFKGVASFFLFVIFFIFLFTGIGFLAGAAALGSLLAGMALKNFIPEERLKAIDSEIRTMAFGFFGPVFFLWVGLDTDVFYLLRYPLLILAVLLLTNATKIITSYFMGRKVLGPRRSVILGISLTVKFGTSIVIIKLLFEQGLIPLNLYSVFVGATILFKFIVPFLLSHLMKRWRIGVRRKTIAG